VIRKRLKKAGQKKFVRDTLVLQFASLVQSGTYLVTSLITTRMLGLELFGRWTTSRELYMILFFLVNLGLTNAAVSRYSKAKGLGDKEASVFALAALLKLGGIMALSLLVLGWLAAPSLAAHFYEDRSVGVVAGVLCLATVGEVLRSLTLAIFNGTRQMRTYATFDVATNLLRVGLVAGALFISPTPTAAAWAFVAHGTLSGIAGLYIYRWARRLSPDLAPPAFREVLAAIPRAPLSSFFGLSFLLAIAKSMNVVVPRLGMLFIPAVAVANQMGREGMEDNGAYKVGSVLTMVLGGAIGAIGTNILPTLGLKMGQSDVPIDKLGGMLRRLSLTAGALGVGATVLSIPFAWLVITYGYGPQYAESFEIYLWLATGFLFTGFAVIIEPFYIYADRMKHCMIQNLVYATLMTVGIYSATKAWGPKGAAAAAGLGQSVVVFHLVYILVYFRRAPARLRARSGGSDVPETPRAARDPVDPAG
jgi:O-antigen/teichoic acid export membrane protein